MADALDRLRAALVDRYMIEGELGSGGMATVYLARDLRHQRRVALKTLRPELAADVGAERFLQEITVTANLQHPHILPLHDSGEADGVLYYVMPYIEGESLRDKLSRERELRIEESIEITRHVASALDYAHRQGVVHRDIKPENILLHDGQAVVADFGIARAVHAAGGPRITQTGLSVGTPHYMSPEQASGDREVDGRGDVYSLGAMLYEMLTGEPPHTGNTAQAIIARLLTEQPTAITHLRSSVPGRVNTATMKALNKTPVDRFPTAGEFATALVSDTAVDPRVPTRGRKPGRRATALALGIAALGIALVVWWVGQSPGVQSVAVLPLVNLSGNPDEEYFVQGVHAALITELQQISAFDRVSGRTSVMRFRDSAQDLEQIAAALDVDAVVEGSVLRVGDSVRIDVGLVHVSTDRRLWGDSYEDDLGDVLALQRRVTRDIARGIALTLTPAEEAHLAAARPVNPVAYDLYLRGRFQWNRRSEEGFRNAISLFSEAIEIDSAYAAAYAGLSDAYNLLAQYTLMPTDEALPLARSAAERALTLDSTLAEAYKSWGEVLFVLREWDGAEEAYRRAIALNPAYPGGHHFLGWFLSHLGRHDEAIQSLQHALELDPLSAIINADLTGAYMHARQYDEARIASQRLLDLQPEFLRAEWTLIFLDLLEGNLEGALAASTGVAPFWGRGVGTAQLLAAAGRDTEARALIQEDIDAAGGVERVDAYTALALASAYVALDDYDTAVFWFEHSVDTGVGAGPIGPKVWPFFDPLYGDPRFMAALERMGYPD